MSCRYCNFWNAHGDYDSGDCRLNPEPVPTEAAHMCGRFMPDKALMGPWGLEYLRESKMGALDDLMKERDKRIALEKKAKALRKELKTLKERLNETP